MALPRTAPLPYTPPAPTCGLCPRLVAFREANSQKYPNFFNGAVPSFGSLEAQLLVVGLAPGLKGANQTGRPFTGDYAGLVLYPSLLAHGFAKGVYAERPDDGLELVNARITNAVRCVPPENKPTPQEITTCRGFLERELAAMPNLRVIVSLGGVSWASVLKAYGEKLSTHKFRHEGKVALRGGVTLLGSYHCSRYNINTGRLTREMFDSVIATARACLAK